MEIIATAIQSSLVSFFSEKLNGTIDSQTVASWVDEWLGSHAPARQPQVSPPAAMQPENLENPELSELQKLRVSDLKVICKNKKLSQSGNKTELIDKILQSLSTNEVEGSPTLPETEEDKLKKLRVFDLKAICKDKKIPQSGTKAELINKILGISAENSGASTSRSRRRGRACSRAAVSDSSDDDEKSVEKSAEKSAEESAEKSAEESAEESVVKPRRSLRKKKTALRKVTQLPPVRRVTLEADENGTVYHKETGLVFNENNEVIAVFDKEGNIKGLTKKEIKVCNEYAFNYVFSTDIESGSESDNGSENARLSE